MWLSRAPRFSLVLLALLFTVPAATAGDQPSCVSSDGEFVLAGLKLGDPPEHVLKTLGKPTRRERGVGEDDGGTYEAGTLVYPQVSVVIVRGVVDKVITRSPKISTPSGIRPGMSLGRAGQILGVKPTRAWDRRGYQNVYFCNGERRFLFRVGKDEVIQQMELSGVRP